MSTHGTSEKGASGAPPAASDMPTAYDAQATESKWYAEWLRRGYFEAHPDSGKPPFCIVLPPPNITGRLHVGHALNHSLPDIVVRRRRMQGFEALFLPGTDHAGIATQVVVQRELAERGIDPKAIGREAFVAEVWKWKEQYGGEIVEQVKAMGQSLDWSRLRFTMDERLARAVRVAFVRMYEDGLIYRGKRIINWCPRDTTALSDSEVEHEEVEGELVTFRYDLSDRGGHIDVATTRIETMLGDTGVAVHPDDDRYRDLVGKTVRHPFTGQDLPIMADEAVDPSFGTGAVKVTPAHDPVDFEMAQRHDLPAVNILTADAHISDAAPEEFRGLDRYEARVRVLERLQELGKIVKVERPYVHAVGHCYRCHTELEPWLSGEQWFVAVDRLRAPAKQAALDGRIKFFPERWANAYVQWLDGLRDWNISRQLWWGHRIPVWYCANGHQFAGVEDPDSCAECGSNDIEQDPDVLDTWFSSQLWPFSTLGWPDQTDDLAFFYPTSVLITGYEILYLWVARMVMSGLYFMGEIPFQHVMIHGLVRDPQGRKMSKSLGNVIDPLDVIGTYGADALRFALTRQAGGGQDIPLSTEYIEAARRFANKIWNATRLVLSNWEAHGAPTLPSEGRWTLLDRWLLSRHQECLREVDAALEEYRFSEAAQALYRFFWSEFCDWALEAAKPRLYEGTPEEKADASNVLAWVLERSLRMLHPFMPFVTEETWQRFEAGDSIMIAPWPEQEKSHQDTEAEARFNHTMELITAIRRFRKAHGIQDSTPLTVQVHPRRPQRDVFESLRREIERLAGISSLEVVDTPPTDRSGRARVVADGAQVLIPLVGILDVEKERARLSNRIQVIEGQSTRSSDKLANESFLKNAPAGVVEKERAKLRELLEEAAALGAQLEELG
jgi:valyl-tRNA synthetase